MKLQLSQIDVQPGERVILRDISWSGFEQILEELGHHLSHRVAYYKSNQSVSSLGHQGTYAINFNIRTLGLLR